MTFRKQRENMGSCLAVMDDPYLCKQRRHHSGYPTGATYYYRYVKPPTRLSSTGFIPSTSHEPLHYSRTSFRGHKRGITTYVTERTVYKIPYREAAGRVVVSRPRHTEMCEAIPSRTKSHPDKYPNEEQELQRRIREQNARIASRDSWAHRDRVGKEKKVRFRLESPANEETATERKR